jgi:2-methylcitrate dehydratase PrpD
MLEIREKYHPMVAKVGSVEVKTSSAAVTVAGKSEPQTGLEGKFSLRYCTALALMKGRAVESDFTDESVNEPDIKNLMLKVNVIQDESFIATEAEIKIKMTDGAEIKERLELGSKDAAVSVAEWESTLEAKSSDFLKKAYSAEKTAKIINAIKKLDRVGNVKNVV